MELLTAGYGLIEGPVWHPERGLIFSDVVHGGVYCLAGDGAVSEVFPHRRGIGGMSLHVDDGLVVSGRNIAYKAFAGGDTVSLLERDEANGLVGFNDITTDQAGRVYAGGLGASPVFADGRKPASANLYMVDLDGSVQVVGEDVRLTNGLGFAPDGKTLYHSDTLRNGVFKYAVHDDGTLGAKEHFLRSDHGVPDGLVAMDAQHGLLLRHGWKQLVDEAGVAVQAGVLGDAPVARLDAQGIGDVPERERQRVEEPVVGFGHPLADRVVVPQVAIVAGGDAVVARLLPRVVVPLHHVAVGAAARIVHEIRRALPVAEGERPQAREDAERNGDARRHGGPGSRATGG